MSGEGIPRITKLDTDNYLQWSIEIEHYLRLKGCWGAVCPAADETLARAGTLEGAETPETPSELAAEATRQEDHAMSYLMLSVKAHHMATFRRHRTAREAWRALEHEFRCRGPARAMMLRRELINLRMGRTENVIQFFNRGKTIIWELKALDASVDDDELVSVA